jgi:four helix bundle protein
MRFLAYDLSIELVTGLRATLARIKRHDAALAKQGRDAAGSVPLNLNEGNGRVGGDRLHHFRIALGSLREVGAVLDVAVALGYLDEAPLAQERDRLCGIIYSLQR